MELYKHDNYDWYVAVQKKLTAKKVRMAKAGKFFKSWVGRKALRNINDMIHTYTDPKTIVCHGCRLGVEVAVLQKLNPDSVVFGTDIYGDGYAYDKTYFREMDFDTVPDEWKGYFDVIYSNSLDHSRNPINTLLAWKSELRPEGIMFINFHWGRGISREDCFHLDPTNWREEVLEIAREIGMDVLYISDPKLFADGANYTDVILKKCR